LEAERHNSVLARQQHAAEVDALSARLGALQARLLRLDALGNRLVRVAGLEPDEFDFGSPPSQGGAAPIWLPTAQDARSLNGAIDDLRAVADDAAVTARQQQVQLAALADLLLSQRAVAQARPEGLPVAGGWISSYFGRRTDPFTGRLAHHRGIDLAGREGSPVVAVASGIVVFSGHRAGYGNLVEINHGGGLITRYGHNARNHVAEGATVERGDVIADMGATGRATGPHLHFEVHRNGRAVDPLAFIAADDAT
jgi:murein DD-endopeptidase MepM/ murein hydrolase activator NlpD